MNGEHCSLPALVNLCLSACGLLIVNDNHCRSWPGDVHVGDEKLCIIYSDADGQLFYVGVILRRC